MSGSVTMATLKDGSQVPLQTLNFISNTAGSLLINEELYSLYSLIQKCKNTDFEFTKNKFGDPSSTLKEYHLIDGDGNVPDDIRRIVLSFAKFTESSVKLSLPIEGCVFKFSFDAVK